MMSVNEFFNSRFFDSQWKNKVFAIQVVVTFLAFTLGIVKLATRPSNIPMSRNDVMAITMSIKSFFFLGYEFATERIHRFQRFGSLKAYAILNTLDILFWMVVMGLTFSGVSRICVGANCGVGVCVGFVALINAFVHFWAAVIAWKNYKYYKTYGVRRGEGVPPAKNTYIHRAGN